MGMERRQKKKSSGGRIIQGHSTTQLQGAPPGVSSRATPQPLSFSIWTQWIPFCLPVPGCNHERALLLPRHLRGHLLPGPAWFPYPLRAGACSHVHMHRHLPCLCSLHGKESGHLDKCSNPEPRSLGNTNRVCSSDLGKQLQANSTGPGRGTKVLSWAAETALLSPIAPSPGPPGSPWELAFPTCPQTPLNLLLEAQ